MKYIGPFAAERSCGTKSPNWRANDALGHVEQRKFKFGGFLIALQFGDLYHLIAQLQRPTEQIVFQKFVLLI